MKLLHLLVLIGCLALVQNSSAEGFFFGYGVDSLNSIWKGLGKEIPKLIPKPEELFKASKDILFGLPETAIFQTINKLCSSYMNAETINPRVTPDNELINLRFLTPCKEYTFLLSQAEKILENPEFDVNKKLAIFTTGWLSSSEADYVKDMAQAYNCRGDYNFLALNTSGAIDTLYSWSAFNTEEIGRQFAAALAKLVEKVPVENIHLIGHSLGAHISGYAGRYFTENTGLNITRITGLDPANPCFNEGQTLSGLQRGDAEYIDIIHSNPGVLGKANPLGDVDFFPDGLSPNKPGCVIFGCSHSRSYQFYTESVYPGNEENFLAIRCTSLTSLNDGYCRGQRYPMGFAVPFNLKGNYFLNVNAESPYGRSNNDRKPILNRCDIKC